ncbi:hypothetical protein BJ742DRAFT_796885 [Cladochytrium replicatum]|nr:hypothetical protein BJ742DRAFT_796885 [Cladochytrium replicatum]
MSSNAKQTWATHKQQSSAPRELAFMQLPYIPPHAGIPTDARVKLLSVCLEDFNYLLSLDHETFLENVLRATSATSQRRNSKPSAASVAARVGLNAFLESYLHIHWDIVRSLNSGAETANIGDNRASDLLSMTAEEMTLESAISEKVFRLVHRIAMIIRTNLDESDSRRKKVGELFTLPMLMDFAAVYGAAPRNRIALKSMFSAFLTNYEANYRLDLHAAVSFFEKSVRSIQKKREKESGGAKFGGKGKGKGGSSSGAANGKRTNDSIPNEALKEADYLIEACQSFKSLVLGGGRRFGEMLENSRSFTNSVLGCYEVATLMNGNLDHEDIAVVPDQDGLDEVSERTGLSTMATKSQQLKWSVLTLLNAIFGVIFLEPLGLIKQSLVPESDEWAGEFPPLTNANHGSPDTSDQNVESQQITDRLCDFAGILLEHSHIDGPVEFLRDAPILVDYEVEYGLGYIVRHYQEHGPAAAANDTRLAYLALSLEQILTFSGNAETRTIRKNNRRRAAKSGSSSAAPPAYESAAQSEDYIKRTSLISQVHDLFPELGEGFIEACLIALNDDAETLIMKILEDDIPPAAAKLDRKMARAPLQEPSASIQNDWQMVVHPASVLEPNLGDSETVPDILSTRKNIYDGDEFDLFARKQVDSEKVIMGKKQTGDLLSDTTFNTQQKSTLLSKGFDEYEDEYDDTYDSQDIKLDRTINLGLVEDADESDESESDEEEKPDDATNMEKLLVEAYLADQIVFDRSMRRSQTRVSLREKTKMSDEQIEGWFRMFERNPKKQQIIDKLSEWVQPDLDPSIRALQQAASKGRKQGGGGSTPNSSGYGEPASPIDKARRKQNSSRGSGGNHNRRRGRQRKFDQLGLNPQ